MIQRIQSLWLLLATVVMLLVFKFPFASAENQHKVTVMEKAADNSLQLFVLAILLSISSLIVIFLFKRRSKQKRIIWLAILTCILYLVLMFFQAEELKTPNDTTVYEMKYELGAIFPVLYIILLWMAHAGIRRDEKLIRSQRRLRE